MPHPLDQDRRSGRRLAAAGLAFAIAAGLVSALVADLVTEPASASVTQTASTLDSAMATDGDRAERQGPEGGAGARGPGADAIKQIRADAKAGKYGDNGRRALSTAGPIGVQRCSPSCPTSCRPT